MKLSKFVLRRHTHNCACLFFALHLPGPWPWCTIRTVNELQKRVLFTTLLDTDTQDHTYFSWWRQSSMTIWRDLSEPSLSTVTQLRARECCLDKGDRTNTFYFYNLIHLTRVQQLPAFAPALESSILFLFLVSQVLNYKIMPLCEIKKGPLQPPGE